MEQSETVLDRDSEIRRLLEERREERKQKLLLLDERREERKQKLLVRLGRNLSNPLSVTSWEALTGTLRSKKTPTSAVKSKEPVQVQIEKEVKRNVSSWDALRGSLKNKKVTVKATTVTKPNETVPVKIENAAKSESRQIKRTLSFGQTATSLKRTNLANGGATLKRATSFKSIPTSAKKPVAAPATQLNSVQKQKLTVPCSPNFTNRTKQQTAAIKSVPVASSTKPVAVSKRAPVQVPRSFQPVSSSSEKALDTAGTVPEVTKRKSSSWMIPLTPERKASPSKSGPNAQHTPNVKPFIRKSFSESKTASNRSVAINRSVSSVSMIRPSTSTLPRRSVAPSLLGNDSSRRSVWGVSKEPSEKEKVQQWLEKRGRSVASCRHLGCLGHQLQDFKVPERKSSSVKSIRTVRPDVITGTVERSVCASPILLKRKSSVMNTTFEKEDEDEQRVLTPPSQPDFENETEEAAHSPRNSSVLNVTFEKEDDQENPQKDLPAASPNLKENCAIEEETDHFHTPTEINKRDSVLDLTDLQEGRVDSLMETISALFNEPIYPEAKIESWLNQSEAAFPAVKSTALYWDIKARLEERRGNTMEALDIYSQALENKTESLDTMKQFFDSFLLRIGSNIPTGQRTPLLKSLGVETPLIRQSRRLTARRPLLDSAQAFNSTTVKYELKLKQVFDTIDQKQQENNTPSLKKKTMKTPMKFNTASNRVSVASECPFQLVATPVRRSMRPHKTGMTTLNEQVVYVAQLDELSPGTRNKAVVRKNNALTTDL